MNTPQGLQASLSALTQFFVGDHTLEQTLQHVSEVARLALPQTTYVGVTIMVNGRPATAAFTDREVLEIDERQYADDDGPCLDAFREGVVYQIHSTRERGRWQRFRDTARAHGVLSTMSLPMTARDRPAGAMNLYADAERAYGEVDLDTGSMFAAHAAFALVNAQAYWDAQKLNDGLRTAMQTRSTIDLAKGIIMANMRCDPDEAMAVLVRQSQHQNVKLRDIAAEIVANVARRD